MIIKDAQSLPTISALYLTKKIRVQEESKWNELDPRRRCYLQRNPERHKDSKGRVKCSLNCTTDTQADDAKTLEWDYKSRRVSGFFSFLSKGFHPKEVAQTTATPCHTICVWRKTNPCCSNRKIKTWVVAAFLGFFLRLREIKYSLHAHFCRKRPYFPHVLWDIGHAAPRKQEEKKKIRHL